MLSCHSFSPEVDVAMLKRTEEQSHCATGRLQANQGCVAQHMEVCRVTVNRLCVRYNNTGSIRDRPRSGRPTATTPAQNRYIRLIHIWDKFRTATSTTSQIPGIRLIPS